MGSQQQQTILQGVYKKMNLIKRIVNDFTLNWNFTLDKDGTNNEGVKLECPNIKDYEWRNVDLPHDWSIEGPFRPDNSMTSRGGYLPAGIGWYYKDFTLSEEYKKNLVTVEFDGIYMNSDVWINGHHLGHHPFGYTGLSYNLSKYLNFGETQNQIVVRVDNSLQPSARWYTGSGIVWDVRLLITDLIRVKKWGVYITTPTITTDRANVIIRTEIENNYETNKNVEIINKILSSRDENVDEKVSVVGITNFGNAMVEQMLIVNNPELWDMETPNLYKVHTALKIDGIVVDDCITTFGIRDLSFDPDKGMFINGKSTKVKGVCIHNDNGCLGVAAFTRAYERRLELLKDMGCNAIRTSHNPFPPQFLDLCDKMGFLIMNEAFDEWVEPKKPMGSIDGKTQYRLEMYGYARYFEEWHEKDMRSFVRRDRNHPSVIMWSIGNEIRDLTMETKEGIEIGKQLIKIVKEEDPSRLVTCGCNITENVNRSGFAEYLDIVGYNYREFLYHEDHEKYPKRLIIGSETVSHHTPDRRGEYDLDMMRKESWFNIKATKGDEDNFTLEEYNRKNPSMVAEYSMRMHMAYDFIIGFFIWTGFDYIGEPAPYLWPVRSSCRGVFDICGFPKDGFYFYKAYWKDEPLVHIFPHWNHRGMEGTKIPVIAFTNCDYVELYLNGNLLGRKDFKFCHGMHLKWEVEYQAGTLQAIGYKNGEKVCTDTLITSGEPDRLEVQIDRTSINSDRKDLAFVKVIIVDKDGIPVPDANSLVQFEIDGEGEIAGVDNGDTWYVGDLKGSEVPAFNGLCMAVVRSTGKPGLISLNVKSSHLKGTIINIQVR